MLEEEKDMDFEPKNCPVGISNEKNIENVKDKFEMAIQRLEEKLDDMKNNMDKGFSSVNKNIDKLSERLDTLESNLPKMIDDRVDEKIEAKRNSRAWDVVKWIVVTLLGSAAVAMVTKAAISFFG